MKRFLPAIASVAAVVLLGAAAPYIHPHVHGKPRFQPHEVEAAKESIALSLMGQLQLSVGDLMWLKSMEYLHVGVVQRMPTRAEEEAGYRRRDAQNVAAGLGHVEGVKMVLDPERDWRGIFGEVERNTAPYLTEHKHDDPVELIPWYQLAVRLNPSLERLYTLGAFYLADFANEPGEALEMLEAGVKANPQSFEIHAALGRIYVEFSDNLQALEHHHGHEDAHHDDEEHADDHHEDEQHHLDHPETAEEANREGVRLLSRAVELAAEQRRQMAASREIFDDFQNQVFGEAYLYLSKAHQALGEYELAVAKATEGYDTVSQYNQRNLLRVQARVAEKAKLGEEIDAADQAQLAKAGDTSILQNQNTTAGGTGRPRQSDDPVLPVSVLTGIIPPAQPLPPPSALEPAVLADVRAHPYEAPEVRAGRLGVAAPEVEAALAQLELRRFVAVAEVAGGRVHHLLPPGLYVATGRYGFDFWDAMRAEAEALSARGVRVDLVADAKPDQY